MPAVPGWRCPAIPGPAPAPSHRRGSAGFARLGDDGIADAGIARMAWRATRPIFSSGISERVMPDAVSARRSARSMRRRRAPVRAEVVQQLIIAEAQAMQIAQDAVEAAHDECLGTRQAQAEVQRAGAVRRRGSVIGHGFLCVGCAVLEYASVKQYCLYSGCPCSSHCARCSASRASSSLRIEGGVAGCLDAVDDFEVEGRRAIAPPIRLQAGVAVRAQLELEAVAVQRARARCGCVRARCIRWAGAAAR